ncbi:hypothetical protein NFI96_031484 [Prochilodus magdalenae]|nr:hypothetical protein NFI96_031484 [Prochilodus magdalenae]
MMFLCSLSLFIIMIESCVSQSISSVDEKRNAVEGETVTLSCSYTGRAYFLYWYRQYPGSRPEFLLRIDPDNNNVLKADPPFPRLDVKLTGTKLDLVISSAAVSDSVLYYCALQPTVTRSSSTLYKNSLTDKALRPTMRPGEQAGECRGGAPSHQLDYGLSHKQATVGGRYGLCVRYNTLQLREPQGTVLDSFLFTLYTADFTHNTTTCLQVFSDDSTTLGYISDGDKR